MVGIKGQGQGRAKGQIHLIGYNFASNCHRDFKLASYFSLQKAATNMTLTLTSSLKVKMFETSIKENLSKYAWVSCTGHNQLLASKVKVKVKQKVKFTKIGYNFASNCHRDFQLVSYFSL